MAGSLKDALRKSGLAPEAPAKPPGKAARSAPPSELSDDESLPPLFDAPALTKVQPSSNTITPDKPKR